MIVSFRALTLVQVALMKCNLLADPVVSFVAEKVEKCINRAEKEKAQTGKHYSIVLLYSTT